MAAKFAGRKNIAMKVPPYQYDATVAIYRDLLGLKQIDGSAGDAVGFVFGTNNLWIDRVPAMSKAELWLEIVTDTIPPKLRRHLQRQTSSAAMRSKT
jgi:hypothetical protein